MSRRSQMDHKFSMVPQMKHPRSSFNRSYNLKTTFDADYLIPFHVDEVLPGDTVNISASLFGRLSTPLVPLMDNLFLDTFWFFIPNRLVQDNWKKMMGEQDNPGDSISYSTPQIQAPDDTGAAVGSLWDYFGLPTEVENLKANSYLFRAYNRVYNEWFRDENLQNAVTVDLDDGPDTYGDYVLLKRGKRHDYFTSCLPYPQKGGTAVTMPISGSAPVKGIGKLDPTGWQGSTISNLYETGNSAVTSYADAQLISDAANAYYFYVEREGVTGYPAIYADLSAATSSTINEFRQAIQVQALLELDMRSGTRYPEFLQAHFGVIDPSAAVLQRTQYLGGSSNPLGIHPVAQTNATGATGTAQGHLAAFATATGKTGFVKSFTEHGHILGLVNVRADLSYQQGVHRMWSRRTRYDFYLPILAHLGEQAVKNKEIYAVGATTAGGATTQDDATFGYQERWSEYKYLPSKIMGKFRSTYSGTLDMWHLAQKFTSLPVLDSTFITSSTPMSRVLAVNTEPHIIMDGWINLIHARRMPVYSVPAQLGRF